jgi:hypothetical protein
MSSALVALIVVPVAMAIVAGLLLLIARPLAGPLTTLVERQRLHLAERQAATCDAHLAAGRLDQGLRALEQSFCLITVRTGPAMLDAIAAHHLGLLSRVLAIADASPTHRVRPLALAKVERLLERRREMQRALLQLGARPAADARRQQLTAELQRNRTQARLAIRELTADLQLLRERHHVLH